MNTKEWTIKHLEQGKFCDDEGSIDIAMQFLREQGIKIPPFLLKQTALIRSYRSSILSDHPELDQRIKYAPKDAGKVLRIHTNQATFNFLEDLPYKNN